MKTAPAKHRTVKRVHAKKAPPAPAVVEIVPVQTPTDAEVAANPAPEHDLPSAVQVQASEPIHAAT